MGHYYRRRQYIQQTNSRLFEMQTGYAFNMIQKLIPLKNWFRYCPRIRSRGSDVHDRVEQRLVHILLE